MKQSQVHERRDLQEERSNCITEMRTLTERAIASRTALTTDQQATYDRLNKRQAELTTTIDALTVEIEADRARGLAEEPIEAANGNGDGLPVRRRSRGGEAAMVFETADGRQIRALRHGDTLASTVADPTPGLDGLSFGKWIQTRILGARNRREKESLRAMTEAGSGGTLVPEILSATFLDLVRNATQCIPAGVITIPVETSVTTLAKLLTDPVAYWRGELVPITPSDMTFGPVTLTAKTAGCLVSISEELLADALNGPAVITNALTAAMANEIDRVILEGSGVGAEPKGILGGTGVQTIAHDAPLANYGVLLDAMGKVMAANGEPRAAILNPRDEITLQKLTGTLDGQYLVPPPLWQGVKKFYTNQVSAVRGTPGVESTVTVGNFSQVALAMRTQVQVDISRYGDDFAALGVSIRAWCRVDVALLRAPHLCTVTGVGKASE